MKRMNNDKKRIVIGVIAFFLVFIMVVGAVAPFMFY